MTDIDYDQISPGVRDLVRELNEAGYETTDSGDGTNYRNGMEGALPYRHVFGVVPRDAFSLQTYADKLQERYPDARVEVHYSPGDKDSIWLLLPDGYPEPSDG